MSRILVVDDDDAFRSMLRRTLQRLEHHVIEAADGEEAIEKLAAGIFDLVITDIIMPNVEGIETIRTLRRTYPDLKVIAMSGGGRASNEVYLNVAKAFGAFRVLSKPFTNDQLLAAINEALA
jgi:CheY-like chemotaxis protein